MIIIFRINFYFWLYDEFASAILIDLMILVFLSESKNTAYSLFEHEYFLFLINFSTHLIFFLFK